MFFSLSSSSSSSSISPVFVCCCLPSSHSFYLCFSGSLCASYIYISPHDQRRNTAKNKRKEKEDDETKRRQNFKHFSDPKCQMPNTISMQLYIFGSLCFFFVSVFLSCVCFCHHRLFTTIFFFICLLCLANGPIGSIGTPFFQTILSPDCVLAINHKTLASTLIVPACLPAYCTQFASYLFIIVILNGNNSLNFHTKSCQQSCQLKNAINASFLHFVSVSMRMERKMMARRRLETVFLYFHVEMAQSRDTIAKPQQ